MWISVIIHIYNLFFILLLPILLLRFLFKSLQLKSYRQRLKERLGIFKLPKDLNLNSKFIWIHAVSVGEVMAAIPIINKLKHQLPKISIILTCTTTRGSEIIQQKLSQLVIHVYFPLDISFAINTFLSKFKPVLLIIIEKELWPNLIWHCNQRNIPIIIINAQLSNKSFKKYLLINQFIKPLLNSVTQICTQTKFDAYKFKQLLSKEKHNNIIITGNIKFDIAMENKNLIQHNSYSNIDFINQQNTKIWIAASTHSIEENLIFKAHQLILKKIPNTILILAPRHPERINLIIKEILKSNFTYQQHSLGSVFNEIVPKINAQIYLVDSIGELNKFYQISQAAFVGGSLIPNIGGHNVLEPAVLGLPIAIGPYTANCQQIVTNLRSQNGLKIVKNPEELAQQMIEWLNNKELRENIGNNAKNYLIKQSGVSDKIMKVIYGCLSNTSSCNLNYNIPTFE